MAGPIARRPAGLLDLLLTQQQGRNPSVLGDDLLPIIDMLHFYEQERLTSEFAAITVNSAADSTTFTVPAGESWKCIGLSARGSFATAAQSIAMGGRISGIEGQGILELSTKSAASTAISDLFGFLFDLPECRIWPSGTKFSVISRAVDLDAQASISVTATVYYVRMET